MKKNLSKAIGDLRAAVESRNANSNTSPTPKAPDPNTARFAALQSTGTVALVRPAELERQEKIHGRGLIFGRLLRAMACASKVQRDYTIEGPLRVMRDLWRDPETSRYVEGLLQRDMSSDVPTEGSYLVPQVLSSDLIELLREDTVLGKLGARIIPMPNGNLRLPRIDVGSTSYYVGENRPAKSSSMKFGDKAYLAKKLMTQVPVPNDLLRSAAFEVDVLVRDDASAAMAVKMDWTGFNGTGTADAEGNPTPRGLRYDPTRTQVNLGALPDPVNMVMFITALMAANVKFSQKAQLKWCFNSTIWAILYSLENDHGDFYFRDQLDAGMFLGYPYERSQLIPNQSASNNPTDIYFGDWREYIIARQGEMMQVDASGEAAYEDGASGEVRAAYSRDQTVLRVIDNHDFGLRQGAAMTHASNAHTT